MFFSVVLSKDGNRLSYRMSWAVRAPVIFVFISLILMFAFNFTAESFGEAPLLGKINTIVLPLAFLLGTCYRYRLVFDKGSRTIDYERGLLFPYRRTRYTFEDLRGLRVREYRSRRLDLSTHRYTFGFYLGDRFILIDRASSVGGMRKLYSAFKAFFPDPVNETE